MNGYQIVSEAIFINEIAKWKKLLLQNKLSDKSIEAIKKANIPISKKRWILGIVKGNKNIMKKHGIKIKKVPGNTVMPDKKYIATHAAHPSSKTITLAKEMPRRTKRDAFLANRHELDEIVLGNKIQGDPIRMNRNTMDVHSSPRVIQRERDLVKHASKMFRNKKGDFPGKDIAKQRLATGQYQTATKLTPKQVRKVERDSKYWDRGPVVASDYIVI